MRRPRAAPVRVSSALTRRLPWYALSADDADAAMVPADAIANPTLFKSLLNA